MASEESGSSDGSPYVKTSLSVTEIEAIKHRVANGAPYAKRLSFAFCVRLAELEGRHGEAWDVLREIDALEGLCSPGNSKDAAPFRKGALRGFWHKHFSTSRHTIRNFGERWNLGQNGNRDLDKMIKEIAEQFGEQPSLWPKALAHRLVIGGLKDRSAARRITGDWIIFAKGSRGENYYLDLATHEEGVHSEKLLEKLRSGCDWEFPEFF